MRTLTVSPGWAELFFIPINPKDIENRSWPTSHRGPLLIHAGRSKKAIVEACGSDLLNPYGLSIEWVRDIAESLPPELPTRINHQPGKFFELVSCQIEIDNMSFACKMVDGKWVS